MSRINRKNWTKGNIGYTPFGDIDVFLDNNLKSMFRLN